MADMVQMGDGAGMAEWLKRQELIRSAQEVLKGKSLEELARGVAVVLPRGDSGANVIQVALDPCGAHTGLVQFDDVQSFLAYLKRHASKESSSVYLKVAYGSDVPLVAVAVLDDHAENPGWRLWRARLEIRLEKEAADVLAACTGMHRPLELAEVIEDHEDFIVDPPAAKLLEIATTLKAAQNARLKEAHNLANGDVAIEYVTETTATAGTTGTLKVPEEVRLRLALFEGQEARELVLKFRYRVNEGKLVFALSCPGFVHVLKRAAQELRQELTAGCPCPVYLGEVKA